MATGPDLDAIRQQVLDHLTGGQPPTDLLDRLGGWPAIEALAPHLTDSPLLTPVLALVSREIGIRGPDSDLVRAAVFMLVEAVTASTDPMQFAQGIDELCRNRNLLSIGGTQLASRCLALAQPPQPEEDHLVPSPAAVSRHADALEAYARLAIAGYASEYKLFSLLEDIAEPQPRRYAQAIVRSIGAAFDLWQVDDRVVDVIDILTGVKPPRYTAAPTEEVAARNREYGQDIASDASWTKANIEMVRAFRSSTAVEANARIGSAVEALRFARAEDEREDVEALDGALRLLQAFIGDQIRHDGVARSAGTWDLNLGEVETLARRVRQFTVTGYGLNHWSGNRKQLVLTGWARLAHDIAWLRDKLDRDSLYDAAVVLDDLLQLYSASHTYELTDNVDGIDVVRSVVRPAIAGGFAARAGLMRNLHDHIEALGERIGDGDAPRYEEQLAAALALRDAARASLQSAEPPGKDTEQVAPALPPLLAELLGRHDGVTEALAGVDPAVLRDLNTSLADIRDSNALDHDLVITDVRRKILDALAPSADFRGDVVPAVQTVLDQLIRFVSRRMNTQESTKDYLFKVDADEHDLHKDLYDWLCQGPLSGITNVEVQEVGAGRTDIQITFPGFHLYLELKADDTMVPVENKSAYIKQTITYQATDVRIGFLVVLRLAPPRDKGPAPHLRDYISHTTIGVPYSEGERHVIMLEIPGRQTKPSRVR
ncbi:hypothetical protein B0I31_10932 [Saccharothrix carnea]|uniref:Uncharacterized protein n=1 Tax=Saccharothrix carnea TaxID=1280637 RepID=A0A2P8I448_SACCR|nr:hypothetical protein [Saccharothrix carnea]PSL53242.1 hypothetical protein B0I31_10932 [Saccharothrix carnea]